MSALESKGEEDNGDMTVAAPTDGTEDPEVKVAMGETHQPSQETMDKAEALKVEGNALLSGESIPRKVEVVETTRFVIDCRRIA